jgi:threonine dehydrogenase-like Zn-dependent dehydrogenase
LSALLFQQPVKNGDIDPTMVITHRMALSDAANGCETFLNNEDHREKVSGCR